MSLYAVTSVYWWSANPKVEVELLVLNSSIRNWDLPAFESSILHLLHCCSCNQLKFQFNIHWEKLAAQEKNPLHQHLIVQLYGAGSSPDQLTFRAPWKGCQPEHTTAFMTVQDEKHYTHKETLCNASMTDQIKSNTSAIWNFSERSILHVILMYFIMRQRHAVHGI